MGSTKAVTVPSPSSNQASICKEKHSSVSAFVESHLIHRLLHLKLDSIYKILIKDNNGVLASLLKTMGNVEEAVFW